MSSASSQEVLFIASRSPWAGAAPVAGAELLMTAAVFDQPVSVVFCGDGVWQLLVEQDGSCLELKTLARIFPAFDLYDIKHIYVTEAALRERALTPQDLVVDAKPLADADVRALIANSKAVFVF